MSRIHYLFMTICLFVCLLGCGKTPRSTATEGSGTVPATSAATESTPESTTVPTTEPTAEPASQYPTELAFSVQPDRYCDALAPITSSCQIIRSADAFRILVETAHPQNTQDREMLQDLLNSYNETFFSHSDLVILRDTCTQSSPDQDWQLTMERIALLDEETVAVNTSWEIHYGDGSKWTDGLVDPYVYTFVETSQKLPKEAAVYRIHREENTNEVQSPEIFFREYPEGYPSYWVQYSVSLIDGEPTGENLAKMYVLSVPETIPSHPNAEYFTGSSIRFHATSVLTERQDTIPKKEVVLIRSREELGKYMGDIIEKAPEDTQRTETLNAFSKKYDASYFENSSLLLLTERLWTPLRSVEVEGVELLSDGSLKLQMHSITENDTYDQDSLFGQDCQYFLIEVEGSYPAETKVLYSDRHEFFLFSDADLDLQTEQYRSGLLFYEIMYFDNSYA